MHDPVRPRHLTPPDVSLGRSAGRIELWHAPVAGGAQPGAIETRCLRWLDADERARAERFRQPRTRHQHVVGRGMARRLLAGSAAAPASIRLEQTPLGKPYVAAPPEAERLFNIAHTDRLAVCAIVPGKPAEPPAPAGSPAPVEASAPAGTVLERLGVDVERSGRRTSPELARRYFSRPEYEFLASHDDPNRRRELFLRIWTLKESFIKAIGTGLQTPLADFAFVDVESPSPRIRMLDPKLESDLRWSFWVLHPRPGFVSAVAMATKSDACRFRVTARRFEEWIAGDSSSGW